MSDNIPFDLQLAIMNRLPVKSLLQFCTVSKSWKYSIDCVICSVDDNLALSPVVSNLNFFSLTPFATSEGPWYVSVFTLSSRTWYKLDSYCLPRESIRIKRSGQAVVGGKIFWVIDMPEEMLVGQCLPPYYISQLGDCIIISGSFKFVDFSIIYAWELQVDDGEVSWYRKLFTLPYPIEHDLKLIGFTKDKQPIVEASFVQQLHQSLQVFNPTFQIFQNLVVESNHGSFFIGPYKESLILLNV
ncbi:F-box domain containing protein [Tanacetum coccineum]